MMNPGIESRDWEVEASVYATAVSSRLLSVTIAAPGLTAARLLRQARGQERFFWQAAHSDTAVAGFGVAADLRAWGDGRFESIRQQAAHLFADAIWEDAGQPLAAPRLFGGFAFSPDFTPDNTWAVFHPAQFILPHYQLVQAHGESWLTINAVIAAGEEPRAMLRELRPALQARYAWLMAAETKAAPPPPVTSLSYPMPYETWEAIIHQATAAMRAGPLNKVVLSRVCEIRFADHVQIEPALNFLNRTYPDCHRFLFEPRPYHAFYGATPELLARVDGRRLTTMGLAGSIGRGQTPAEDEALAQALRHSGKDLHEHALVVASIQRRLQPVAHLTVPPAPEVLRLGYIQHLHTPIHGRLHQPLGILPLVERLHPTPALGGTPRAPALAFISQAEPVPRGWYAAPVGWIDPNLDGVFAVAIRSAVVQDRRVWLHAGAGIVAGSEPQKEWAETALKFQPMLRALRLET